MSTDFKWTDDLVMEFRFHCEYSKGIGFNELLKTFKASKQPKPEWEIVSYRFKPLNGLSENYNIGYVTVDKNSKYWVDAVNGNTDYEIYSVKRSSDGIALSIGDKTENSLISGFMINGICMYVILENGNTGGYKLIQHVDLKQVVFTTEDGVGYYEDERKPIYCIHTRNGYISAGAWHIDVHPEYYDGLKNHYEHFFSTKEKAEEYCLWQKPMFSLQEIKEIGNVNDGNPFFQKLIQKAKDKLNLK